MDPKIKSAEKKSWPEGIAPYSQILLIITLGDFWSTFWKKKGELKSFVLTWDAPIYIYIYIYIGGGA